MVVVRRPVAAMNRDIELVRALHEVECADRELDGRPAGEALGRELLDQRVRPIDADALGTEEANAKHKILNRPIGSRVEANRRRVARVEQLRRLSMDVDEMDV